MLDIRKLLASGEDPSCNIDTVEETTDGGAESDCPAVIDTLPARGGPHWGALDNLELGDDGYYHETTKAKRLAYSNYFVARTGLNGDHRLCIVDQADGRDAHARRGVPGRVHRRGVPRLRPGDLAARRLGSGEAALHALRHRR